MKSAYELAMERLSQADPDSKKTLTPEQKDRLAEIDRVYKGKIAEREIFLKQRLEAARVAGKMEEIQQLQRQVTDERARIEEVRDAEKERVRRA